MSEVKNRSVTVKLKYPVKWGEETISEITINPPKAGHIEHLGKDVTMKDLLTIASKCSGIAYTAIKELDSVDAMKVSEVVGDFLGTGRETGEPNM
jgi:hypothetical protein